MTDVILRKESKTTTGTESSVLQMLSYFSIFDYPLTKDEIKRYLHPDADADLLENALEYLVAERSIFKIDEFYLLQNDIRLVNRRREGNLRAARLLPTAMKIGKFLFKFPYIRGIGISGSLSKMYADKKADIDFFIITKANRLWIARTLMHLFKKLTYLRGRQHFYCMNYYVDEKALKLEDRNIYTAVEVITLLPVCGKSLTDFIKANNWINEWFAEYSLMPCNQVHHYRRPWMKKIIEWMCNNKAGNLLDDWLMKITVRRWKKKQQQKMHSHGGKEMALITGKHFARSNPGSFQEKFLAVYDKRINEMKEQWPEYFGHQNIL
jgi:hypothetical protein